MGSFNVFQFFIVYAFGGLTFLPLVVCLVLLHAHFTFPFRPSNLAISTSHSDTIRHANDDDRAIKTGTTPLEKKFQCGHESDVAEGYFAVCREYVPGGINGKPPERTTPAGQVVAEESPSVYQSMYRSIFDRKQTPTLETTKGNGKSTRRARNVFYVVLRHGHLMLYDDAEQVEVRHVISLAHHNVGIYGGGNNEIPEGELWIKRNAVCLRRKQLIGDMASPSKPFYFFSENCSDKEDFYFALLRNQDRNLEDPTSPPEPQHYEIKDIISLVQRLHSSEEHLQTRWINAMIGRLFLAIYKTEQIEEFVRMKITKKIARVKKPAFLSGIVIQQIDLGGAAPFITNPHLKDLTVEGDCCVEADFKYDGNFRIEIAATARIDLGTRFKAREVNLVLAAVIKKLEGHALVRFKPPPSNRIWFSFESMPTLEMSIEPIVSSRQITYGIILRAIESRIREVIAETLVLPHWDDSPFMSTLNQEFRGGIWAGRNEGPRSAAHHTSVPEEEPERELDTDIARNSDQADMKPIQDDRSFSMPALVESSPNSSSRKGHKSTRSSESTDSASSSRTQKRPEIPKSIRSRSFASAADPIVSMDNANVDATSHEGKTKTPKDAASIMFEISNRSQPTSPLEIPVAHHNSRPSSFFSTEKSGSISSTSSKRSSVLDLSASQDTITDSAEPSYSSSPTRIGFKSTDFQAEPGSQSSTSAQSTGRSLNPVDKKQTVAAIGAAAAAAKKWGWNAISRNIPQGKSGNFLSKAEHVNIPTQPIGRGRPLPPPGQPLPPPEKRRTTPLAIPKRKPLPAAIPPERQQQDTKTWEKSVPVLPSRPRESMPSLNDVGDGRVLVVEAPPDSESSSPLDDGFGDYLDNVVVDEEEAHPEAITTPQEPCDWTTNGDNSRTTTSHSNYQSTPDTEEGSHYILGLHEAAHEGVNG
ncbi:hypothetical protein MMC30_003027 [Trapelia coarctata]|nr:hypothetical protein [Trapelia coarctata]